MSSDEFERGAAAIIEQVSSLPLAERYAAAARGSANPAALAWLAEGLQLGTASRVVDLGAGMGGPAGWLIERYGCSVVAVDPAASAAMAGVELFGLRVVRAGALALPLRDDAFDAGLLLGVVSVVADPVALLVEARRVARRVGVLEWCATRPHPVCAGGSTFPTPDGLLASLAEAGWDVQQSSAMTLAAPHSWHGAAEQIDTPPDPDEQAVAAAIEHGELAPYVAVAQR